MRSGPVRAGLIERPEEWPWSNVRAHLAGADDQLTTVGPVLERTGDFAAFLDQPRDDAAFQTLRRAETIGRPLGASGFLAGLEARLGRSLKPQKRGPKRKQVN